MERRKKKAKTPEDFDESVGHIVLSPMYDRGGPISEYSGPSGPIVTLAKVMDNLQRGKPPDEGLPPNALNDPNAP